MHRVCNWRDIQITHAQSCGNPRVFFSVFLKFFETNMAMSFRVPMRLPSNSWAFRSLRIASFFQCATPCVAIDMSLESTTSDYQRHPSLLTGAEAML